MMSCAANGVDALRNAIIELAKKDEIDDVLVGAPVQRAERGGGWRRGKAKFLLKVAEVCVRERKAAGFEDNHSGDVPKGGTDGVCIKIV